ncbi:MAG: metallophosphoesterase family protein [Planctomycetaceae bacterium]
MTDRRMFWALVCVALCATAAAQVEVPRGVRVPDQLKWRPSAVPDRVVLSWAKDPATSLSVTWRTDTSVGDVIGQIASDDDGPKFADGAVTVKAVSEEFSTDLGTSKRHSVTFENLKPGSQYLYRVGDGTSFSEWFACRTAPAAEQPFRFLYFGDAQNSLREYWSRVIRRAYADAPAAAFVVHAGDLINNANRDAEWGEWFHAGSFIHAMLPCVPVPGNHEYSRVLVGEPQLSPHWRPTFTLPENGLPDLPETCYWFDYPGLKLIALNSNVKIQEQAEWLDQVLTQNQQPWVILTFHHPLYSSKAGRDNADLRAAWQPIIDRHRVDLVLQGHDHTYARTGLMTGDTAIDSEETEAEQAKSAEADAKSADPASGQSSSGTVYVVSVSGPKMYDLGRRSFMLRAAEDTQMYQIISIDGATLHYEARAATGTLYDSFLLTKSPAGPNILKNEIPNTAERRRPPKTVSE